MDDTPIAKILPPSRPSTWIERKGLSDRMAMALERRLTVVDAEAGYGKSTMLASWWESAPCAWYTVDRGDRDLASFARCLCDALRLRVADLPRELDPLAHATGGPEPAQRARADALGSRLAGVLHDRLAADTVLVLDDVHELPAASPSARLVEALCRHAPPRLRVVLSGRGRPPFPIERFRGRGQLLELTGHDLAFSVEEVARLVEDSLGGDAGSAAADLHRLCGGWPAAVVLAIEVLRASPEPTWKALRARLERSDSPVFSYLAEEVFAHQTPRARALVRRLAVLDSFTPALCDALAPGSSAALAALVRQGLFVEPRPDGTLTLLPLVREFARERLPVTPSEARDIRLSAAHWHRERGNADVATDLLVAADAPRELAELLASAGDQLVAGGHLAVVLDACRSLPPELRSTTTERLEGEVLQVQGDWTAALECFERAAGGDEHLPAALAWRMVVIRYLRGELDAAMDAYRRGAADAGASPADAALLLAWAATVHWVRNDVEACRDLATRGLDAATACGDHRALAAAHTVMAMLAALDGDRRANDEHYLLALRSAEAAPDVLQMVRIRTNRASHFLEEGSYPEALAELEVAVRLAELTSFASFLALSLSNRGETKLRMGRLGEALADLEASRARYVGIGSDMVAYPVTVIGEVYRERGNLTQAYAAFEEAVAVSDASGDSQGLVPALAGLATVLAVDEPERARSLAQRAVDAGTGLSYVAALNAAGWVAVLSGDRERAAAFADRSSAAARSRHDRAGLADALAVAAMAGVDRATSRRRLRDSQALWHEIGDPIGEAKAELALAALDGAAGAGRRRAAERRLESLGVGVRSGAGAAAGLLAAVGGDSAPALRIQTLGGFAVVRDGGVVRVSEWQSRRARELLKLLVARRGRPAPREALMEALWPGESPDRVANRLSVALTTVRNVLDPEHRLATDAAVKADMDSVALDINVVEVDLERFLLEASEGVSLCRRGEVAAGIPLLEDAASQYAGDFLEENAYDDWAVPAREEARAAFVTVARTLASEAVARGDTEAAVPYFLRILEVDRYDEQAHLGLVTALVAASRHGEAHRRYLAYREAMEELAVEPSPFPQAAAAASGGAFRVP